jgi:hypothetical protein
VASIDPRARGTLYHAILAECFRTLAAEAGGILKFDSFGRETLHARLLETSERHFEVTARTVPIGYPLLWSVEKGRMRENLRHLLEELIEEAEATGYFPAAFEWAFGGEGGAVPAVTLTLPTQGAVRFQGRIDRIDVEADGPRARVIDYKTKDSDFVGGEERIADGRTLQLPIYMRAAEGFARPAGTAAGGPAGDVPPESAPGTTGAGGAGLDVAYAGYVFLSGDKPRGIAREGEGKRRAALGNALDVLIASIRSGDFTADPRERAACDWCDVREVCGESRLRLFARKREDGAVAARLALRDRP